MQQQDNVQPKIKAAAKERETAMDERREKQRQELDEKDEMVLGGWGKKEWKHTKAQSRPLTLPVPLVPWSVGIKGWAALSR